MIAPIPKEPSMCGLLVGSQLGMSKKCSHLFSGMAAMVSAAAQSQTPLTNDDREPSQFLGMFLHSTEMLRECSPMPLVLEAVIPMHLKANTHSAIFANLRIPVLDEFFKRPLKNWEANCDTLCRHATLPDYINGTLIEAREHLRGHLW